MKSKRGSSNLVGWTEGAKKRAADRDLAKNNITRVQWVVILYRLSYYKGVKIKPCLSCKDIKCLNHFCMDCGYEGTIRIN